MQHNKRVPRTIIMCVLFLSSLVAADEYQVARAEIVEAFQAKDFSAMRAAAERTANIRPGFAGALFNLAYAQVLDDDAEASLATLNQLLEQKIDFGVADIEDFSPLKALPNWAAYAESIEALHTPVGDAQIVHRYIESDFIPEGIAVANNGDVFLGSIRNGSIMRLGDVPDQVAAATDGPHWSVFGMRLQGDKLWFVSSAISEFAALDEADHGRNGLFAIDTRDSTITTVAMLPTSDSEQVLGDLIVLDAETLLLTDQADGTIYRFSISSGEFSVLIDRGVLNSPQGLVTDESGDYLYVADYTGGLFRITLAERVVERVAAPKNLSVYGIDGLYRHGSRLIAIQNGIQPNRVVEFELSDDGLTINGSRLLAMNLPEFDEPNLGEVIGDKFVFIANSHWNRFDRDGNLPDELSGPVVLEIDLSTD